MKKTFCFIGFLFFLSGCACATNNIPPKKEIKSTNNILKVAADKYVLFRVVGTGVAPCDNMCNMAQAKVMARRAAILNAYEQLAEKIYGIKIEGVDNIKNLQDTESKISAYVKGIVKGAVIDNEEFKNGIYYVTMSLKLNAKNWNNNLTFK